MTEEKKFCRICKNLGIDCELGTFYCSLSHRPDKLPNTLKCDEFILCDFITQLEQENNELKEENIEYDEELAIEKLSHKSDLETLERYRSALEEIRKLVQGHKVADGVRLKSIMHYIDEVIK